MENNTEKKEEKKIYHFNGKEYVAKPELSPGSCSGCAFIQRTDCCKNPEKLAVCREHKIFMRHLKHDD